MNSSNRCRARAVDQEVADLHHHPAEQLRVDGHLELDRAPGQAAQRLAQALALVVVDPSADCTRATRQPRARAARSTRESSVGNDVAGATAAGTA